MPVVWDRPQSSAPAATSCPARLITSSSSARPCSVRPKAVGGDIQPDLRRAFGAQCADGAHLADHLLARAAQVGHQRQHRQPRQAARVAHHLGLIGHLRQQSRRDEAATLDLAQAGGVQCVDPVALVRGGHRALGALQAVARTDLADPHGGRRR
jgi:hypothetical protein